VNKEIALYNRKLYKVVKTTGNVKIIQTTLNRNDFTRHRIHVNISGKEKVPKLIGDIIKNP
jgi:F420-dependent methylenetetrahydromethanopterin dehydrogenase